MSEVVPTFTPIVAREKCRICGALYELGTDHTAVHCERERERERVNKGEKCPCCGTVAFHQAGCSLWALFRERGLT